MLPSQATVDVGPLLLSAVIVGPTAFVLLDLAGRIRAADAAHARLWRCLGGLVAGSGWWAAHFVVLNAHAPPIPVGYAVSWTVVSWLCGVGAAALTLSLVEHAGVMRRRRTIDLSVVAILSAALCMLHYTEVAALELTPGVEWNGLAIATVTLAGCLAAAFAVALARLGDGAGVRETAVRAGVALALAAAFHAFATTGVAAAVIPRDAVSLALGGFVGEHVADFVIFAVPAFAFATIAAAALHDRVERRRTVLAGSLEHVAARLDVANDALRQRAMLDPLTGLPNRTLFEDRLAQGLARAARARRSVRGLREKLAVLFIDIDGFKPINDSFGHAAGDELIREVAERLRRVARDHDTVSRVGADQFLMLMDGATSSHDCVALATRVLDASKDPIAIHDRNIQISVSIGIVVYPDHCADDVPAHGERSRLLAQADAAMQAAKRAGRGTYALFESHMHRDTTAELDLINDLRQAMESQQLELHYQPKVDGRRHVICGVEALLRWHHPVRGTVGPAVFIPLAERFGMINALGSWVIDEACRQMEAWTAVGVQMRVAINLSVHQLREADLVSRIEAALKRHNVRSSQLLCEITESVAMQDIAATQRTLDALGRIGVYLAIDDFGTGYSSLSYLRQLPARQLKIDRTFIADLDASEDAKAVVDGVVRLAHALGLRVVAEGVETATQRDILLDLNCDELQGFFFAKAMPADKLLAWMNGGKPVGIPDFAGSLMRRTVGA